MKNVFAENPRRRISREQCKELLSILIECRLLRASLDELIKMLGYSGAERGKMEIIV